MRDTNHTFQVADDYTTRGSTSQSAHVTSARSNVTNNRTNDYTIPLPTSSGNGYDLTYVRSGPNSSYQTASTGTHNPDNDDSLTDKPHAEITVPETTVPERDRREYEEYWDDPTNPRWSQAR